MRSALAHLVPRGRREAASKDAPGCANEAANWTILRDAMLCIAPQDEAVGFSVPKFLLESRPERDAGASSFFLLSRKA
jgi:hypothetical protein